MRKTGIRELKDHLSEYLTSVKNGETIVITHHKKTIAKVVPVEPESEKEIYLQKLQKLADRNLIILPSKNGKKQLSRIQIEKLKHIKGKPVSEIICEDRR